MPTREDGACEISRRRRQLKRSYYPLFALISMHLSNQSHNLVTDGWNLMKRIVMVYS